MIPIVINNNGRSQYGVTIREVTVQINVGVIESIIEITPGDLM